MKANEKKQRYREKLETSAHDDRKTWMYAFILLLAFALTILVGRVVGSPFLAFDFEICLIYLPTIIAGLIVLGIYLPRESRTF